MYLITAGNAPGKELLTKIYLVMRITALLLFITCLHVCATGYSQKVTLDLKKASLQKVFAQIILQTDVTIIYDEAILKKLPPVEIHVKDAQLADVLKTCLAGQGLSFEIKANIVNIKPLIQPAVLAVQPPKEVSGKVTDEKGNPIPGVVIVVKGTNVHTTTDANGNYTIKTPSENDVITFSYIGYVKQELAAVDNLNVKLHEEVKDLTQVVVVGYGTQKKVSLTSAVGTIRADDISKRVVSNTQQALQGLAPGLTVLDQGGAPGRSVATMRIRGVTTISGAITNSNNPLVLVDGIEQGINNLNPDDIASVSVLKDAAATSIYGSRAATGVILITTKRAAEGDLNISWNAYYGLQKLGNHPKHMDTQDYMRQQNVAYANAGQAMPYSDSLITAWGDGNRQKHPLANDWYNVLYHTAPVSNNNFTISGGNKQLKTLLNLRYFKQEGIVNNFSNEVKEIRLNTDFVPNDKLKFSVDANYRMMYSTAPFDAYNVFYNTLHGAQFAVPRYTDGGYGLSAQNNSPLVSDELSGFNNDQYNYFSGNLRGEWQILKGLKFSTQYGIVSTNDIGKVYRDAYKVVDENNPGRTKTSATNELTENRNTGYIETINSLLEYKLEKGSHHLTLLGGYSQIYTTGQLLSGFRNGFYNNDIQSLSAGAAASRDNAGRDSVSGLRSYFGRLNYDFAGKYLLEANGRYDGSSNFTGSNLYSFFPSFSVGWRPSQEKFWEPLLNIIPEFKLRASWGKTGNQTVLAYSFYDALGVSNYNFGGTAATGYILQNYANKDIKWETTTQTDIGLDAGFLQNKLNFTFDYYNKKTEGILLQLPISAAVGLNAPVQNAGVVSNKGWEVALNYRGQSGQLRYDLTFNISDNINNVVDLKGTGPYLNGGVNDALYVTNTGLPIGALWGFKTKGLYKDQQDVDTSAKYDPNTKPGDIKYLDITHDGKINADDRTVIGDPFPHYSYGFTSNLQYKNFDFYLFIQGVAKQDARISGAFADAGNNQGFVIDIEKDYWTPENTNAHFARPQKFTDKNAYISDFWIIKMGYLRVKNLQLGYTLPKTIVDKMKIRKARFYVSASNLLTFSKANKWGIDPEFPSGRSDYFPQTKNYTIGLNVNF
jgi:TonB-linked SusC/RagA family outer membrane protein